MNMSTKFQKRNQKILLSIVGKVFYVHNGKGFIKLKVSPNIVSYKFGAFVFTRHHVAINQRNFK